MEELEYLDFDLSIERAGSGSYKARVVNSPAGKVAREFQIPFSDVELENFLLRASQVRRGVRGGHSPDEQATATYGGRLFKTVFAEEILASLQSSLTEAGERNSGLRIRLNLTEVPELAGLPWEYLYNPSVSRFLAVSNKTPIVRYLEIPENIRPVKIKPPLRILVVISSPTDFEPLDVEHEWATLKEALGDLEDRGLIILERLETAQAVALQRKLRQKDYHIFHFIGHGVFDERMQDGALILEGENQRGHLMSGGQLGALLHDEETLKLAVLNACEGGRTGRDDPFSGTAQSLIQQGIPAVIAMQFAISDEAAITFAHEFYLALAEGFPIDAALAEARKVIYSQGNGFEWGTPVLYMRSQDGRLFEIDKTSVTSPGIEATPVAWLVVQQGQAVGTVFAVTQGALSIGRAESSDIVLADPLASRHHATIFAMAGVYYLKDMGSTHGTLINGKPLEGQRMLQPGDMIRIGQTMLEFSNTEVGPAPAARKAAGPIQFSPEPIAETGEMAPLAAAPAASIPAAPPGRASVAAKPAAPAPVVSPRSGVPLWAMVGAGVLGLLLIVGILWQMGRSRNSVGTASVATPASTQVALLAPLDTATTAPSAAPTTQPSTPTTAVTASPSEPSAPTEAAIVPAATSTIPATATTEATASPTEIPSPTPYPAIYTDTHGAVLVLVPAGAFRMGYDFGERSERPVHSVILDDFYIDKYEVTNAQYLACVDAGVCRPPTSPSSATRNRYYNSDTYASYPVISVSWNQAVAFCEWRGSRLPTEAEWEKAARGSSNRIYPWGDTLKCENANYMGCSGDTTAVGSYPPGSSEYGVMDLAGNVWEWVSDWFGANYYTSATTWENPAGPASGSQRVLKGGSWNDTWGKRGDTLRVSFRHSFPPEYLSTTIGFRCAVDVQP